MMQREYEGCDQHMASKFAAKFMETKKRRDFSWAKNFTESFTSSHSEKTDIAENYLTLPGGLEFLDKNGCGLWGAEALRASG